MFTYEGYKYFLLLVDCYSSKLFVEPLKDKNSETVAKALQKIIKDFKAKIYKLETDRGSEFFGATKKVLNKHKIFYKSKFGKHKANFVERMIYVVKRKLYLILRSQLTENWVKYIRVVVNSYNNTPLKKLGYLRPNDITSEKESVDVDYYKQKHNIETYKQPNFEEQAKNEKKYEESLNRLQKNDYCYKFYDEKLFNKKYNINVLNAYLVHQFLFYQLVLNFLPILNDKYTLFCRDCFKQRATLLSFLGESLAKARPTFNKLSSANLWHRLTTVAVWMGKRREPTQPFPSFMKAREFDGYIK